MLRDLGLIACLAACASSSGPSGPLASNAQSAVNGTCPPEWCGGNSPEIASLGLWEINLDHQPNDQGFVLLGMSKGGQFYDLVVRGSAFIATIPRTDTKVKEKGLKGFTLWLQQGGSEYGVKIAEVGSVHEMVAPGAPVETYVLRWSRVSTGQLNRVMRGGEVASEPTLGADETPLCRPWGAVEEREVSERVTSPDGSERWVTTTTFAWPATEVVWDESTEIPPFNAVVFEGDRIDATARTVKPAAEDRWFNIGCARHTLSKMRLTRNTLHTVADADWRPVQTALKMLSADYCGNGTALTVPGMPILWQQHASPGGGSTIGMTYRVQPQPGSLEARWNENGAVCLDTPRLAVHPDPQFPDVGQSIKQACAARERLHVRLMLACKDPDPLHAGSERFATWITTANYDPPP